MTPNLDFKLTELLYSIVALDVLCVQLTRDLFAITKFLLNIFKDTTETSVAGYQTDLI